MSRTEQDYLPSSGKTARDENFPVASVFFGSMERKHVKVFYRYARAADDIADTDTLNHTEKLSKLSAFTDGLDNSEADSVLFKEVAEMRVSLQKTGITPRHCQDLIRAFSQDATKQRYASWSELMNYCSLSAAPVGRYLIDLHNGPPRAYPASDALCNALQVLNHLQDCSNDFLELDRVYLPLDWMRQEGAALSALSKKHSSPELRRVLDHCLSGVESLLKQAAPLSKLIHSRRLAMNASAILAIAWKLTEILRKRDPLAERVTLNFWQFLSCMISGSTRVVWDRTIGTNRASL